MTTVVFLLQKGQFSAVLNNKRCYLRGEESMSLAEYDSEKIVEFFENSDYFLKDCKDWNDTKLFFLYDSESAVYLFNIIEGFELKKKVESCENFSFQIKLEEKPIDLNGNIEELLKYLENGDAVVIGEKDKKIKALKNEIKEKDKTIKEINDNIKKLESANSEKDKKISKLNKQVEKQKEDLKEILDPYSKLNFIDRGDYIELERPLVDVCGNYIKAITKQQPIMYLSNAMEYAKTLRLGGFNDWRVPTKDELYEIYKIRNVCGIKFDGTNYLSSSTDKGDPWVMNFYNRDVSLRGTGYNGYVLCVR